MSDRPQYQPLFIRAWREHKGLTQEKVIEAMPMDFSVASLSRLETGKQPYTQQTVEAIAKAFNCAPSDLFLTPVEAELWHKVSGLRDDDQSRALIMLEAAFGRRGRDA